MAFSMFLRSKVCTTALSQQFQRFSSSPTLVQRSLSHLPACNASLSLRQPIKTDTPIFDSVRTFRTSSALRSNETPHDHARLWVVERAVTAALVPLIPLALAMPCDALDCACAILITAHSFWGLEAVVVDYVRATLFGPVIPKLAIGLVYLISIATLGGLFYLITHDVGLAKAVRQLWAVKSAENKA